jgi:hypothetical protein
MPKGIYKPICKTHMTAKEKYRNSLKGKHNAKAYYVRTKDRQLRFSRERALRRLGLKGIEEYNELLAQQKGKCAICGSHESVLARRLAVDHSHKTGEVRGLLCFRCNASIGKFEDNIELLEKAIVYLRRYENASGVHQDERCF